MKKLLYFVIASILVMSVLFQSYQAWKFINTGPRFTANDGQALCERVAALELLATGTRLPCVYEPEKQ